MDWFDILKPVLYAVLSVLATVLGIYAKQLGTKIVAYFKSKIEETTYNQAIEVARGLYIYLEDKYGDSLQKMGEKKKEEMETLLLEKFPQLSQTDLDAINKTVWLSFQAGYDGSYSRDNKLSVSSEKGE